MSFTDISQLTENLKTGTIVHDEGFYDPGHTFFYAEDIKKVLAQAEANPKVKLSQLRLINVKFEKNHGEGNHNIHNIKVLALAKEAIRFDEEGNIVNEEWYEKVALPWAPYYDPETITLENEDPDSEFFGRRFSGHPDYKPGLEIHK